MQFIKSLAIVLLIIGGLNWGLEAFGMNIVETLFNEGTILTKTIYILVGISALVAIPKVKKCASCGTCNS